jgi:hypothetical protein
MPKFKNITNEKFSLVDKFQITENQSTENCSFFKTCPGNLHMICSLLQLNLVQIKLKENWLFARFFHAEIRILKNTRNRTNADSAHFICRIFRTIAKQWTTNGLLHLRQKLAYIRTVEILFCKKVLKASHKVTKIFLKKSKSKNIYTLRMKFKNMRSCSGAVTVWPSVFYCNSI